MVMCVFNTSYRLKAVFLKNSVLFFCFSAFFLFCMVYLCYGRSINGGLCMNILFVCTGNTCRSPMAAALLSDLNQDIEVKSAGVFAMDHQRANEHAHLVLQEREIVLDHYSQPVTDEVLQWADLVLTMTIQHKQSLIVNFPHHQDKYYTLKEYVSESDQDVWNELRKTYADLEVKRSIFIQENEQKLSGRKLDQELAKRFKDDIEKIQRLEANLIDYDISDPFGGNLEVYRKTLHELDQYIKLLNKKIKK